MRLTKIRDGWRQWAIHESNRKPTNLRNSITGNKRNQESALGEIGLIEFLFREGIEASLAAEGSYDYDVFCKGVKIEVKTTKTTQQDVKPYYSAHICNYNDKQDCDCYVFVRANFDTMSYLPVGWIYKHEVSKGNLQSEGSHDESNDYTAHADNWEFPISSLRPMSEFINRLKVKT